MSLSQKHSGKVLVPWFNIAEWKTVHELIYDETKENWPKALEILKIWKLRTPLLSAGVEGTLIVLESLLVDTTKLTEFEATHILSTSLVRFLNLCAANSDKQGTFYKVAKEHDLPKWLIGLRHDIAHSHKVPSQSMLELSLRFCLDWIDKKYWQTQLSEMTDLIVNESNHQIIEDALYIFLQLSSKTDASENIQYDDKFLECLCRLPKSFNKIQNNKKTMEFVTNVLKDAIRENPQGAVEAFASQLIYNYIILTTDTENDDDGTIKLPDEFVVKWRKLFNTLYETEILLGFIQKLFQFTCNPSNELHYREIASLWIKEVFQALNMSQSNSENNLVFDLNNSCMKSKAFAKEVVENFTPFTLNFIKLVLEYNNISTNFIEDTISVMSALIPNNYIKVNGILTVQDINFNYSPEADIEMNYKNSTSSRWQIIENASAYQNLPLGVLPHQPRNINPALSL